MSIGPPTRILNTVADINSRARSLLNDDNAQIWTDAALLNLVRNGYNWLYGQIQTICGQSFSRAVIDLPYTPSNTPGSEQDLSSILPSDLYLVTQFYFRLSTSEEYLPVNRVQRLPSRTQEQPVRLLEWERRGNSIIVNSGTTAGLIKLYYDGLLPLVNGAGDSILIDNAVEAIAHFTASQSFGRRGQVANAAAMMGSVNSKTGATFFADMILSHIIRDEQEIARRGQSFSGNDGSGNDPARS